MVSHAYAAQQEKQGNGKQLAVPGTSSHVAAFMSRDKRGDLIRPNYVSVNNWCLTIVQMDAKTFFILNADPDTTTQLFF